MIEAAVAQNIDWNMKKVIAGPEAAAPDGSNKKLSNPINPDWLAPNINPYPTIQ